MSSFVGHALRRRSAERLIFQFGLVSSGDKADGLRQHLGILLLRGGVLGKLHKVRPLKQRLHLRIQLRRNVTALEAVENLRRGHLHGRYAIAGYNIFPQGVRDTGVKELLLVRLPVFVAPVAVQFAQGLDMGGFSILLLPHGLPSVQQPLDKEVNKADKHQRPQHPGGHLLEGVGELYLVLDVVGLERFHVYGHFLHLQGLSGRLEDEGVAIEKDRNVRQFIGAAPPGGEEAGGLDGI